jgi:hypothetical protein
VFLLTYVNKGNAGLINENDAMQQSNDHSWAKRIPDSLNFSQEQATFILGHSLRSQYQDLLTAELPDRLQALVEQLEKKHASSSETP